MAHIELDQRKEGACKAAGKVYLLHSRHPDQSAPESWGSTGGSKAAICFAKSRTEAHRLRAALDQIYCNKIIQNFGNQSKMTFLFPCSMTSRLVQLETNCHILSENAGYVTLLSCIHACQKHGSEILSAHRNISCSSFDRHNITRNIMYRDLLP